MALGVTLKDLRRKIDEIDLEILRLISERGRLAIEISKAKRENASGVYDPAREREIKERLERANPGPLPPSSIAAIYREIISACRALQHPLKISFLGPEGSFSHQAAFLEFGSSSEFLSCNSFNEVFSEVEKGKAHFGVLPVENSMEGAVGAVLDESVRSPLTVCAELFLRVSHSLLSLSGRLSEVKAVASHPQALGQCKRWLSQHLKDAELIETQSTAKAAMIARQRPEVAAIASELAASLYGLCVIEEHIEDSPVNLTRFWVVGRTEPPPTGDDKTSIVFSLKDEPGALSKALKPFGDRGVNLTKIESRPHKERPWEYLFFVDFLGHRRNPSVSEILREVAQCSVFLKVLGSYPVGRAS